MVKNFHSGKVEKTKFIWPEIGKVSKITISNLIATINLNVDFKMKFDWKCTLSEQNPTFKRNINPISMCLQTKNHDRPIMKAELSVAKLILYRNDVATNKHTSNEATVNVSM